MADRLTVELRLDEQVSDYQITREQAQKEGDEWYAVSTISLRVNGMRMIIVDLQTPVSLFLCDDTA